MIAAEARVSATKLAALMAACTSRAAASILRFRSNCSVTRVEPVPLVEVISLTPAITPKRRSSGVATLLAAVVQRWLEANPSALAAARADLGDSLTKTPGPGIRPAGDVRPALPPAEPPTTNALLYLLLLLKLLLLLLL